LWRLHSSLRMHCITWPVHRVSPKITRDNFLTPNYLFTIQLLLGSFILEHPHVKAIFGRKKPSSQNRSPKWRFCRKFKGRNIKYSHRDPQKHFFTRNDVIWRIFRNNPWRGVGCSLIEEPKKTNILVTPKARQNHVSGEQKPLNRSLQTFLHAGCRPGRNHAFQFLWRSVKGFWCGEGLNFGLSIDLLRRL